MAETKIFAGPKIRRYRMGQDMTQTSMAEKLAISPSYLNLIERNQRPLTVQLLLKLAANFDINLEELQGQGDANLMSQLREVFSDPLLAGELPDRSELMELTDIAPNVATATVKLHRAYGELLDRLSGLSRMMAEDGSAAQIGGARLPMDEVREVFELRTPYNAALERAAEKLTSQFAPHEELMVSLQNWLQKNHKMSVQILPVETMPNWRRRFDRHANRLYISERLSPADRIEEVATEVALLAEEKLIEEEVGFLKLGSDEARRLARFEFARLLALAMMIPYERVLRIAKRLRYDINVLRSRFNVTFAQMAWRLTMLQRNGQSAVPLFVKEIDVAGNCLRRGGSTGFPDTNFGGECPKLVVHQAFISPGQIFAEQVITPKQQKYIVLGRTIEGLRSGFIDRPRRTALLIGFDVARASEIIYADGRVGNEAIEPIEIGPACRLCERQGCISRAQAPITRPLGLDDMVRGLSPFDIN